MSGGGRPWPRAASLAQATAEPEGPSRQIIVRGKSGQVVADPSMTFTMLMEGWLQSMDSVNLDSRL
jgi:hypothetical protein